MARYMFEYTIDDVAPHGRILRNSGDSDSDTITIRDRDTGLPLNLTGNTFECSVASTYEAAREAAHLTVDIPVTPTDLTAGVITLNWPTGSGVGNFWVGEIVAVGPVNDRRTLLTFTVKSRRSIR